MSSLHPVGELLSLILVYPAVAMLLSMARVLKLQTCGAGVAAFCFNLSKWLVDANIQHPCCAFFSYSDFIFLLHFACGA